MDRQEFNKHFLMDSDETGRFLVYSHRTGITYYVEPLDGVRRDWGDLVGGRVQGSYGLKYKGSIKADSSLIREELGFSHVRTLDPGVSPLAEIEATDKLRYTQGFRPGVTPREN